MSSKQQVALLTALNQLMCCKFYRCYFPLGAEHKEIVRVYIMHKYYGYLFMYVLGTQYMRSLRANAGYARRIWEEAIRTTQ
jgi:hypothetical protein